MSARWSYVIAVLATAMAFDVAFGQGCPPAPRGYTRRVDTDWLVPLFSPLRVTSGNPSTSIQQCNSNPNCLAFNARGQQLIGQPGTRVTYIPFRGFCTYIKDPNFRPEPATPACAPAKKGYTLKADTNWVKGSGNTESQTSPSSAEQRCDADANCVGWNSFGYLIYGNRDSVSYTQYKGLCVYVKDAPACAPAKKGYTLKADTNWVKGTGNKESQTSPKDAEQRCDADSTCVGWNSFGYLIYGNRDSVSYTQYKGLCVYVKDAAPGTFCPRKNGYEVLPDTNWDGQGGTKTSQATSPDAAARICNLDANCVAWNSFGYYILGEASDIEYNPYKGLCVYVKKGRPITLGRH